MARKSKLTESQLDECQKRHLDGESVRSLAREFGVSESALRERISAQTAQIKTVANQIVAAEKALSSLPISAQITAQSFASKLRAMSDNILSAASMGAATSHRLAAIANAQASKVDDADPMQSSDVLKSVAALTEMSNRAGEPAMKLIAISNKDGGIKPPGDDQERRLTEMTDDELILIATGGA